MKGINTRELDTSGRLTDCVHIGTTMDFRKIAEGVADRLQKYYKTAEGWTSAKKSVSFLARVPSVVFYIGTLLPSR